MEVTALASSTERLIQALEASRTPVGEGLVSTEGPSEVPQELAADFRRMLETPPAELSEGTPAVDATAQTAAGADAPAQALPSPEELLRLQMDVSKVVLLSRFGDAAGKKPLQSIDSILRSQS